MAIVKWNPLKLSKFKISEDGFTATATAINGYIVATNGINKGKKYLEITIGHEGSTGLTIGVTYYEPPYGYNSGWSYYYQGATYPSNTINAPTWAFASDDIIGIAIDLDSTPQTVAFYKNNTYINKEIISNYAGQTIYPFLNQYYYAPLPSCTVNFGAKSFKYQIPDGFEPYQGKIAKYLIKQNTNYYSIEPKFYDNGNYKPLTLEGGTIPNDNDFINSGFENLQDLLLENDKVSTIGIDKGTIQNGKYFSIDFPSDFLGISEVK